jgi:hypothetical protein
VGSTLQRVGVYGLRRQTIDAVVVGQLEGKVGVLALVTHHGLRPSTACSQGGRTKFCEMPRLSGMNTDCRKNETDSGNRPRSIKKAP